MSDLQTEYAVLDQYGHMMGLPARTFTTRAAAENLRNMLQARLSAMRDAAESATFKLTHIPDQLSATDKAMLREMQQAWDENKGNTYAVVQRQVSTWTRSQA